MIRDSALLHSPNEEIELSLFTEASQTIWSIIVNRWDVAVAVEQQGRKCI